MSKVMRQMVKQRSTNSQHGFYQMQAAGPIPRPPPKSQLQFNRTLSLSESEIQTNGGFSDSEDEKSEIIDDFLDDDDEDQEDDREDELIHSDFDEDEDEDEEERTNDPFQRQLSYPPLPRYKTPTPANPLDKLGTLTPMEEMTEPPSSGANSPASFAIPNPRSKSRGPSNLTIDNGISENRSRSPSAKNMGLDRGERSPSRGSGHNLLVDHAPGSRSRSQSRTSLREPSPPRSRPGSRHDGGMKSDQSSNAKSHHSRSDLDYPKASNSRSEYPPSDFPKSPNPLSDYPPDFPKSAKGRSDYPLSDFPKSANSRSDYPPSDFPKSPKSRPNYPPSDFPKSATSRSDYPSSDFPNSSNPRLDYPPPDFPKSANVKPRPNFQSSDYPRSASRSEFPTSTGENDDGFALDSSRGRDNDSGITSSNKGKGNKKAPLPPRRLSSGDSMSSYTEDIPKMKGSGSGSGGRPRMPSGGGGMGGGGGGGGPNSGNKTNGLDVGGNNKILSAMKSPKRVPTPLPKFESDMDSDLNTLGIQSDANTLDDTEEMEKMRSFDRVRSWQRHAGGSSPPVYSALADAEFASALDGMIMKLHGSKVDWEYRVKLADDLTSALKNVSPQVLLKNMSQIIPLVSNIAAESHFRVSLSILNTITMLGDRLRDCKAYLGSKSIPNADLTWLIRRLCTVCGESRSTLRTEGALALSHLIKGAGPELVCEPLYLILSSESKKHLNGGTGRLTAGPRIKAAALDALTFALLTFPRDDFDLPALAKHACKSLWNSKRRVRQASLECLAVVAHALGPSAALPLFRNYIDETKLELSSSSSSSGTMKRGAMNYTPVATPSSAVSARVSRHLLPSPSPAGLVEYAVMIPQRTLQQSPYEKGKGGLDPILSSNGSGKNRHSALQGADIAWILAGTGPTVNSTFYSPGSTLDWLAEETGTGWPSEGESLLNGSTNGRHYSKSKMKTSHSYNGTMDLLDSPLKPSWSSSNSGSYMERYHKSSSNGFLTDSHGGGGGGGGGKGDKGYSLLPNKYPNHTTSNGELPNLSSPFNHHNSSAFGDFNSNLWSQHEEFMGFNNNNHHKGFSTSNNAKPANGKQHGRPLHPPSLSGHDKYSDSSRRFDAFSQNNISIDQSDSDHDQYGTAHRSSYPNYGQGEGHFIKINREYDDLDDSKKDGGLDSAGSTNTRDSGVSSLKSSKTIPSPPNVGAPYEARQNAPKMTTNKKKSPSPSLGHPTETLSHARSWRSTPDVPELAKVDDESRKSNEIGSDISRSQSGSSGFLHRKPVLARASQRKTSSDSIQNRLSGLELRDFDDGTESESPSYIKEKIPKPISYHLSLSTNNIASEEEEDKTQVPYSTSSLRRNNTSNKVGGKQPYLKSRSRSRTPVGNRGMTTEMSSMKGDAESVTSLTESSPPKNNLMVKKGTMPKRVYKGSYREINSTTRSNAMNAEVFPADLKPVDSPRHSLSLALNNLNSSEWETNLDGFRLLVRLSRHHPESLRNDLHNININGMRHLMNLRSQVCRSACLFFKELFLSQGKLIEQDVEKISEKLFDKSSDTNKFIREDSGSAIETMVLHLTPAKIIHCLDSYGLKHRNPMVRTTASKMLTLLIRRLGSERVLYDHPEKILPMVMHFLQEGSLDTRTHAKAALAELVSNKGFDSQLRRHVPPDTLRNVSKSIAAIKNEMPSL